MSELPAAYFYGSSPTRLSPKGQLAMPKRFRDVLPEADQSAGFVILPGQGGCLYMYTHRQFGVIRENARAIALRENDPEFLRSFLEEAHPVDLDTQARFVLPQPLRDYAGITGQDALLIGMDDRIEIWEPARREGLRTTGGDYRGKRESNARALFGI